MKSFCESYMFKSLIKDPTRLKNPKNSSCINLILPNSPHSFQSFFVAETGLSDFHKMIVSVKVLCYLQLLKNTKYALIVLNDF